MPKVLIVEDETTMSDMIKREFESRGYEVLVADEGEKGYIATKENTPDIVLLDIRLPDISGYGILKKLKQDETTRDIPVLLMTNYLSEADLIRVREEGAEGIVIKFDVSPGEIVNQAKQILDKRKFGISPSE